MKDKTNSKSVNNKAAIIFHDLKSINDKVKKVDTRSKAITELLSIEPKDLDIGLKLYWLYLRGKTHDLLSYEEDELLNLDRANNQYDELFKLFRKHNLPIDKPEYFFNHALAKYRLAGLVSSSYDKLALYDEADEIIAAGLKQFSGNRLLELLKVKVG